MLSELSTLPITEFVSVCHCQLAGEALGEEVHKECILYVQDRPFSPENRRNPTMTPLPIGQRCLWLRLDKQSSNEEFLGNCVRFCTSQSFVLTEKFTWISVWMIINTWLVMPLIKFTCGDLEPISLNWVTFLRNCPDLGIFELTFEIHFPLNQQLASSKAIGPNCIIHVPIHRCWFWLNTQSGSRLSSMELPMHRVYFCTTQPATMIDGQIKSI